MKQSKELTEFYKDYLNWINDGAPTHYEDENGEHVSSVMYDSGLCNNLENWSDHKDMSFGKLYKEITEQFNSAGLDEKFPFNISMYDYFNEVSYRNSKRIEWVKDHLKGEEYESK